MKHFILILIAALFFASCNSGNDAKSQTETVSADTIKVEEKVAYTASDEDLRIFDKIMNFAAQQNLKEKNTSEIEIEIAKQFINTPYVGHTLETADDEQLVVNLHELDCSTFMENVVTLSLCIKSGDTTFNDYCKILRKLRYRNGVIDKYPSRLHYSTDWLLDNQKKGLIKIVSNDFGNADFNATVSFMSSHPENYKQLSNPEFVKEIAKYEELIGREKLKYITKDQIDNLASNIKDGDIIGFSTTVNGLDISHVVIAAFIDNRLHFYHASSLEKKVVLSDKPMSEYLADKKKSDGILVARILE